MTAARAGSLSAPIVKVDPPLQAQKHGVAGQTFVAVAESTDATGPKCSRSRRQDNARGHGELMRVLTSKTLSPQFRDNVRRA